MSYSISPSVAGHPVRDHDSADAVDTHVSGPIRVVNAIAVVLPFLGFLTAVVLLWDRGVDWVHLGLLLGPYFLTGLGITVGFHRLFTHRSFEAPKSVKLVLAVLGSMAVEGPLLKWVATHRRHHQTSDSEGDPHSPHLHGEGFRGMCKGLWHAHVGWIFRQDAPGLSRYVADLLKDKALRRISALFPLWVALGMLIPAALGGVICMSWTGALLGFIWGGLVRVFLVHHLTWSINSVCHLWGSQPFKSHDHSRNNVIFGVLALGEGWHNNHHAFPTSARHGLLPWQLDASYWVIRGLEALGLASNVKVPPAHAVTAKLKAPPPA